MPTPPRRPPSAPDPASAPDDHLAWVQRLVGTPWTDAECVAVLALGRHPATRGGLAVAWAAVGPLVLGIEYRYAVTRWESLSGRGLVAGLLGGALIRRHLVSGMPPILGECPPRDRRALFYRTLLVRGLLPRDDVAVVDPLAEVRRAADLDVAVPYLWGEFARRASQHQPGFAAGFLRLQQDINPAGADEATRRAVEILRGRITPAEERLRWDPPKGAESSNLPDEQGVLAQIFITLGARWGSANSLALVANALDGGLDIFTRAVSDDLWDAHRRKSETVEVLFEPYPDEPEQVPDMADPEPDPEQWAMLRELVAGVDANPNLRKVLALLRTGEATDQVTAARALGVDPRTVRRWIEEVRGTL